MTAFHEECVFWEEQKSQMERIKELARFFEPDPRNLAFINLHANTGEASRMTWTITIALSPA
jgi:hypothetical protein